jgi:hypothetical protein
LIGVAGLAAVAGAHGGVAGLGHEGVDRDRLLFGGRGLGGGAAGEAGEAELGGGQAGHRAQGGAVGPLGLVDGAGVLEQLGALEVEDRAFAVGLGSHGAGADGVGHGERRVGVAEQALEQADRVRVAGVLAQGAEDRVGRELAVLGGRGAQQDLGRFYE